MASSSIDTRTVKTVFNVNGVADIRRVQVVLNSECFEINPNDYT